jgi:hypothetical protein
VGDAEAGCELDLYMLSPHCDVMCSIKNPFSGKRQTKCCKPEISLLKSRTYYVVTLKRTSITSSNNRCWQVRATLVKISPHAVKQRDTKCCSFRGLSPHACSMHDGADPRTRQRCKDSEPCIYAGKVGREKRIRSIDREIAE